jgi:pyruvate dehydrogenase complex dehydrogenase (E1) component
MSIHRPARDFGETSTDGVDTVGEAAERALMRLRLLREKERVLKRWGGVNHARLRQEMLRQAFGGHESALSAADGFR